MKYSIKGMTIPLRTNGETEFLCSTRIIHVKAEGSYSRLTIEDFGSYLSTKNLKHWSEVMSDQPFIRCHHSHIINISKVLGYCFLRSKLILCGDIEVPVSRRRRKETMEVLKMNAS